MSSLRQRLLHVDKRPRHDRRSEAPISPHLSLGGCLLLHVARCAEPPERKSFCNAISFTMLDGSSNAAVGGLLRGFSIALQSLSLDKVQH